MGSLLARAAALVSVLVAFTLAPTMPADAAVVGPWAAGPAPSTTGADRPFLQYDAHAGTSIHDRVAVTNYGDTPLTFDLYPADGYDSTTGAFVLGSQQAPRRSVGAWVKLPYPAVTVPPHTRDLVPFDLAVPANASPGDYAGGIVALQRLVAPPPSKGRDRVLQREGIATRIYMRVAGPLHPRLRVTGVTVRTKEAFTGGGSGLVVVTVANTGNAMLSGTVSLSASGPLGAGTAAFRPVKISALLPGNSIEVEEPWSHLPFVGPVDISATVRYGGSSASGSTTVWVVPGIVEIVAALAVVSIGGLLVRRRRRRVVAEVPRQLRPGGVMEPAATVAATDADPVDVPAE